MPISFRPDETRPAGYVFPIPAAARHISDEKPVRPFLLLTRITGEERGTLALMTTKNTEELYGAALFEIEDRRGKQLFPGQERSYVDLSSLLFRRGDKLPVADLNHARHLAAVRVQLKVALGIGTGAGPGGAGCSIRGHLVRMHHEIAAAYGFAFGVVLTEHRYSSARRLQVLVPVVDVRDFLAHGEAAGDFIPAAADVVASRDAAWIRQLPAAWEFPVIDTVRLASFTERWTASRRRNTWLEEQIVEVYPVPLDADSLGRIEAALVQRLSLP